MIYHMTTLGAWRAAQTSGDYHAESLTTQGFIHFSQRQQILKVANALYTGRADLVLLCVDEAQVTAPLKYEPPDTSVPAEHYQGELFPHLYGALNTDAVAQVVLFPPQADGTFSLPSDLP